MDLVNPALWPYPSLYSWHSRVFGKRYREIVRGWETSIHEGGSNDRRQALVPPCFASIDNFTQSQLGWNRAEQFLRCGTQGARRRDRSSRYRCPLRPFVRWMVDLGLSVTLIYSFRDIGPLILGTISPLICLSQLFWILSCPSLVTRFLPSY